MNHLRLLVLLVSANLFLITGTERINNFASPKTVNDIVFERANVWIGSSGGLFRFDLSNAQTYAKGSDASFPDPTVNALAVDDKGRVWAGTELGYLLRIDQNGSEYLNLSYVSAGWKIKDIITYGSYLIIGSDKGVSLYDTRKNIVVKNAARIGSFTSSGVNVLAIYNNRLYAGCELGLAVMKGTLDKISERNFYDPSEWEIDTSVDFSVHSIVSDKGKIKAYESIAGYSNTILVTADSNSITVHVPDNEYTNYLPSTVTCMSVQNGNQIWIGTKNDYYYFFGDGRFIQLLLPGPSFSSVSRILVDKNSNLWTMPLGEPNILTIDSVTPWWVGINRYDGVSWKTYGPKNTPAMGHMGLGAVALGSLYDRNGNFWFGFEGGAIKRYNPTVDTWYHYCNYGQGYGEGIFLRTQGACPIIDWGKCDAFAQDSAGYIWISSWNNYYGSLICYKPDFDKKDSLFGVYDSLKGQFKRHPPIGSAGDLAEITALAADKDGNILYGTSKGLVSVVRYNTDPLTEELQVVNKFPNLPKILQIKVAPDGSSLIISAGGVYRYDPFRDTMGFLDDFDKSITSLDFEGENVYWYGTTGSGLVRYDLKNNEKEYYNQASGFPSNKINDVVVDNRLGKVWAANDVGVSELILGYNYTAVGKGAQIVFPNPFSLRRHTVVHFENLPPNGEMRVYTLDGTLVGKPTLARSGDNGAYYTWTPPRSCSPGTYFYSFVSSGVKSSGKLMITP